MMPGTLYLVSLANMKELPAYIDVKILITRSKKTIDNVLWCPDLAPSPALFKTYLEKWRSGRVENWWDLYKERFIEEVMKEPMHSSLQAVYKGLRRGKYIAFICFCNDPEKIKLQQCHRYILGEIIKSCGIAVREIT